MSSLIDPSKPHKILDLNAILAGIQRLTDEAIRGLGLTGDPDFAEVEPLIRAALAQLYQDFHEFGLPTVMVELKTTTLEEAIVAHARALAQPEPSERARMWSPEQFEPVAYVLVDAWIPGQPSPYRYVTTLPVRV
jgi:hypothetical protein